MLICQGIFCTDCISYSCAFWTEHAFSSVVGVEILLGATCSTMCSRLIHLDGIWITLNSNYKQLAFRGREGQVIAGGKCSMKSYEFTWKTHPLPLLFLLFIPHSPFAQSALIESDYNLKSSPFGHNLLVQRPTATISHLIAFVAGVIK